MIFQYFDFEIESIHFAIDLEKRMVAEVISQPEQPVNVELIKSYLNKERMMSAIYEENNESLATSSCRKSLESTEYLASTPSSQYEKQDSVRVSAE